MPPPSRPLDRLFADNPDYVLMGPYLLYLVLMTPTAMEWVPADWVWVAAIVRGVVPLWLVWRIRRHLPPLGKPYVSLAIVAGAFSAALWVVGQHFFDSLGLPRHLPGFPGSARTAEEANPFAALGDGWIVWATISTRIAVATTTVAVVEELFWRAFLLRAMIDWADFERVPLGTFTWFSFLGTSLLSMVQHPDNWAVSVLCWFVFNGLMYWKRSILFCVWVHGLTNLFLYVYVVAWGDWIFW